MHFTEVTMADDHHYKTLQDATRHNYQIPNHAWSESGDPVTSILERRVHTNTRGVREQGAKPSDRRSKAEHSGDNHRNDTTNKAYDDGEDGFTPP